jgi:predicted O-linked N-acetylglucosamine transferase (SPINDLY family)
MKIENLDLDLLFYLDSTMSSVIQRVMMSKLAQKQAVSHGHPVTSGIPSNIMNYYISWEEAEIESAQEHYTENLILLRKEHMHQYYKPRIDENGNSVISGKPYGYITREYFIKYGLSCDGNWYTCMQKPFKLHPEFDYFLQKICSRDDSAKIILHKSDHEEIEKIFKKRFNKFIHQVYFVPALPHHELMGLYKVSDVILDSYYAGGCTTTREALEIGSIVVTLPAKYLGGRWSLAYYNIIGVLDLVAKNKDEYVDIAVKYANNKEENIKMKQKILNNIHKIFYSEEAVKSWVQVFKNIIQN